MSGDVELDIESEGHQCYPGWREKFGNHYIHIYVYTPTYIHIHICVYMCICVCVHICVYIYIYLYPRKWIDRKKVQQLSLRSFHPSRVSETR